jgi:hypothetical protein
LTLTAEDAARILKEQGYTAKIGDEYDFLSDSDVELIYDEVVRKLYNEPVGTIMEVSHFIFLKTHKGYDVFVHVGEIGDTT